MERTIVEGLSPKFERAAYLRAREQSWDLVRTVASEVRAGMNHLDIVAICEKAYQSFGVQTKWHRTRVCIGSDTLKTFTEHSDPNVRLGDNDIYFLDLGPVFNGHEGDVGETYVFGGDPELKRLADDSKRVFDEVGAHWKATGATGAALYDFATEAAKKLGWELNLAMDGHRLGDFPHAVHFKGALKDIAFSPSEALWVLEIQLKHPTKPVGSFYEDILL